MLTAAQIAAACGTTPAVAQAWCEYLNAAMVAFEINTPQRQADFLAEVGHESAGLSMLTESLNYKPDGLIATFNNPKCTRFTKIDAYRYGRTDDHPADQKTIACIAYGSRMGNGPMESGDGWTYRARGPIGVTGKANYAAMRDGLRKILGSDVPDFVADPDQVATPKWGAYCAALFWRDRGCNSYSDAGDFDGVSDVINIGCKTKAVGDSIGYADRWQRRQVARKALGLQP